MSRSHSVIAIVPLLASLSCGGAVALAADGPPPPQNDAPKPARDVTVVIAGSSISINRYGCEELPAWTGGYGRVPPQANGQNVFFRIFEMLNDHENMCWRRLTDKDWSRHGNWPAETRLAYNDACYGRRIAYAASQPDDWAELAVPAGYEKIDLIYTTDPRGDKIKVLVYMTSMGNSKSFRAWFKAHSPPAAPGKVSPADVVADANADACVAEVERLARQYGLPVIDVGPRADDWLAQNPAARFVPHVQVDWYHPNQWGAAVFGLTIRDGISKHWPELPTRPIRVPPPPGKAGR